MELLGVIYLIITFFSLMGLTIELHKRWSKGDDLYLADFFQLFLAFIPVFNVVILIILIGIIFEHTNRKVLLKGKREKNND